MRGRLQYSAALLTLCVCRAAATEPAWTVARNSDFEVYSQAGPAAAEAALGWFEQLRAFFVGQMKLDLGERPPVRVIGFRSVEDYNAYRLRATSDAYYVGTESRDYIVMPSLGPGEFGIAAHEYAHLAVHAAGLRLPAWLNEGLAEFFSTVRIGSNGCTIGAALPARVRTVQRAWMPLPELFAVTADSPMRSDRNQDALFYAESWAVTYVLALSPEYRPRFNLLVASIAAGKTSSEALKDIYGKPLDAVESDAHSWIASRRLMLLVAGIERPRIAMTTAAVSPLDSRLLLAEALLAAGQWERAESMYTALAREAPRRPEIPAALGAIALGRGDLPRARIEWRRALADGIGDALLCYRYAVLAENAGLSADDIRPALERAVALRPDFDDAHYQLALLEMDAGHYEAAVTQFRAVKRVTPSRAYAYWSGLATCLTESGRRDEAKAAAREAAERATTPEERAHANQIAYMAETDFAVRFTRDAQGRQQLVTTRTPHGQSDFNPFIEPGDHIRRVEATLREIQCSGGKTRFVVATSAERLVLLIEDPTRVQMRNAPPEFTCGPQAPVNIKVEYAAAAAGNGVDGLVRGIEYPATSPRSVESPSHAPTKDRP